MTRQYDDEEVRSESGVSLQKTKCNQYVTNSTGATITSRLFRLPGTFILARVYVPGQSRPVQFIWLNFSTFRPKMSHPVI